MTNRAGATNAHIALFFRDSQQLEGKSRDRGKKNNNNKTLKFKHFYIHLQLIQLTLLYGNMFYLLFPVYDMIYYVLAIHDTIYYFYPTHDSVSS